MAHEICQATRKQGVVAVDSSRSYGNRGHRGGCVDQQVFRLDTRARRASL